MKLDQSKVMQQCINQEGYKNESQLIDKVLISHS